jgi:hypothetical protein
LDLISILLPVTGNKLSDKAGKIKIQSLNNGIANIIIKNLSPLNSFFDRLRTITDGLQNGVSLQ